MKPIKAKHFLPGRVKASKPTTTHSLLSCAASNPSPSPLFLLLRCVPSSHNSLGEYFYLLPFFFLSLRLTVALIYSSFNLFSPPLSLPLNLCLRNPRECQQRRKLHICGRKMPVLIHDSEGKLAGILRRLMTPDLLVCLGLQVYSKVTHCSPFCFIFSHSTSN